MKTSKVLLSKSVFNASFVAQSAVIASLYTVITIFAASLNLANGAIQLRFSEALTILPFFSFAGVPGITLGCLLSNIITGCNIFDIIFGTLATFLGALGTFYIGHLNKNNSKLLKFLAPLPPILSNTLIVPLILTFAYKIPGGIPYFMLTVGIGEVLSCGFLGIILLITLQPILNQIIHIHI